MSHSFAYKGQIYRNFTSLHRSHSALQTIWPGQAMVLLILAMSFVAIGVFSFKLTLILLMSAITLLYFADLVFSAYVLMKSLIHTPGIKMRKRNMTATDVKELPMYTILCPLFNESRVLKQFVYAMKQLKYPKDKLQVMLLLEEGDMKTIETAKRMVKEPQFEIVIVPKSMPQTKPKACNYGLQRAKGEYVVIYDAEDIPDADQLLKVVNAFKAVDKKVQCIQAKLIFYNSKQNLLTKLFTLEYGLWFELIVPGYQEVGTPIPLGGTSNHFRTSFLREIEGWDAFNVTEDCDLGIRLTKLGYQTAVLHTYTKEEANSRIANWLNQRSRWIKGYLQTYFVHTRDSSAFNTATQRWSYYYFQLIVGGKVVSMLVNPLMWAISIAYFVGRSQWGETIESLFPPSVYYLALVSTVIGNFLYFYSYMIGAVRRNEFGLVKYAYLVPFYWLLMSVAAWKAVLELCYRPHHWYKTIHGLYDNKELAYAWSNIK